MSPPSSPCSGIRFSALLLISPLFLLPVNNIQAEEFIVTSAANSGAGTLRSAISDANTSPGRDVIKFNLSTSSGEVPVIALNSVLPAISDSLVIDGSTQSGSGRVQITGPAEFDYDSSIFLISANDCVLNDLIIAAPLSYRGRGISAVKTGNGGTGCLFSQLQIVAASGNPGAAGGTERASVRGKSPL